ncbi:2-hydroxychromene-2-carboxylate isomerase [Xenophilus sp. Marseille-Q4582]|uniref:2-hydroxychromene-2-carboxylate isomerase n=1 Tax=Xenophilus sp. Marseille-Q4582 TaxID=2866600 RepID=UPI001CE435F4|nr:2-hydroxychromene-2-carboxylate isomerase [Xenophilus sp. Marseille-Q4582]
MTQTVDFFFDVGSSAAYLAWTQLPRLRTDTGAQIVHKPMLLGAVFQAIGNRSPAEVKAKGDYMLQDFGRFAQRYGVPFAFNPHFPVNTLTLMRGATALLMKQPERFEAYVAAVFQAMWVDGVNMGDAAQVGAVLHRAGFDPQAVLALAAEPEVKEQLKAVTTEAIERGVFGAPTFFVGDQMFWGQDRLDFVRETLASSS